MSFLFHMTKFFYNDTDGASTVDNDSDDNNNDTNNDTNNLLMKPISNFYTVAIHFFIR